MAITRKIPAIGKAANHLHALPDFSKRAIASPSVSSPAPGSACITRDINSPRASSASGVPLLKGRTVRSMKRKRSSSSCIAAI